MRIDILTLFPAICTGVFSESILKRAAQSGLVTFNIVNLRDYAEGRHRVTDDTPFGGGQGMVLKPEPVFAAVEVLRTPGSHTVLLSAVGRRFDHATAQRFALLQHLILVSGHYEGVDERVAEHLADEEISIGDYVLTNGTIAALVVADAVARLVPGVLGDNKSALDDSFATGLLEHPHYTRPAEFRGWKVPEVLLSGNHAAIAAWRKEQSLARTRERRPDLLERRAPDTQPITHCEIRSE